MRTDDDGALEAARHEDANEHESCNAQPHAAALHLVPVAGVVRRRRRKISHGEAVVDSAYRLRVVYHIRILL